MLSSANLSFDEVGRAWSKVARRLRERIPDLAYVGTRDRSPGADGFHIHVVMFRPVTTTQASGRGGWSIPFAEIDRMRHVGQRHGFGPFVRVVGREKGEGAVPRQHPSDRMRLLNYIWNTAADLPEHRTHLNSTMFFASHGFGPYARKRLTFPLRDVGPEN